MQFHFIQHGKEMKDTNAVRHVCRQCRNNIRTRRENIDVHRDTIFEKNTTRQFPFRPKFDGCLSGKSGTAGKKTVDRTKREQKSMDEVQMTQ